MPCERLGENEQEKLVEKVVKRVSELNFYQVIENVRKINSEKCPKEGLRYDIMIL